MASTGGSPERGDEGRLYALRRKVTFAFSATFAIFSLDRLIQLGLLAVLARALSPAQFGIAGAAIMFVSIATQLFQFGMGPALIQAPALDNRVIATSRTLIFALAILCFAVMQAVAPLVGMWFHSDDVTEAVRVLAVISMINSIGLIPHSELIRKLRARDVSLVDLVCGLMGNGAVAVPLALMGFGYWALIWGAIVMAVGKALAGQLMTGTPWRFAFAWSEVRDLWVKGGGFSLTLLLHRVALESDRLIVGRFLTTTALGLYSRANGLMALPATFYGAVVDRVIFPAFSQIQTDAERIRRAYGQALALTALMGGSLSVFLVFQGPNVIRFILGPAWEGAIIPFNILCAAIYFRLSDRVSGTLLRGCGKPFLMAGMQTLSATVIIGGCLVAYRYGISGIAAAVVLGSIVSYILMTTAAVRVAGLGFKGYARSQLHGLATSLLIAAALYPVHLATGYWALSSFAGLALGSVAAGAAGLGALFLAPQLFLGTAGRELLQIVSAKLLGRAQHR